MRYDFIYGKPKSLNVIDEKELEYVEHFKSHLLFQTSIASKSWDAYFFLSLWKTPNRKYPLIVEIKEVNRIPYHMNGFDELPIHRFGADKTRELISMQSLRDFTDFFKNINLGEVELLIPTVVAAFEGEGREIFVKLSPNEPLQYLIEGGSCYSAFGEVDMPDYTVSRKITKKEYLKEKNLQIKGSLFLPEEYRDKHVWFSPLEDILIEEIKSSRRRTRRQAA